MAQYTYLLVDILTIIICFVFSFHPRIRFDRYFVSFLLASVTVGIPFVIWDIWFTAKGVWWFNDTYLVGWRVAGLPIEELAFFICIPFSCVFTYYCFEKYLNWDWAIKYNNAISITGSLLAILALVLYHERIYTTLTAVVLIIVLLFVNRIYRFPQIGQATLSYALLMPGFIVVNGILTGTGLDSPVVNYSSNGITGYRFLTIPVEDFVYGYILVLLNILLFTTFRIRQFNFNIDKDSKYS